MFRNLKPLFPYLQKYRRGLVLGGVCVLMMNGIWVWLPTVLGHAADSLKENATLETLAKAAALVLTLAVTKGIFQFLIRWILIGISRDIEYDLRNDLFRHLESLSYDYYQRTRIGDIMARTTNDLNAVRQMLGP